MSHPQVLFDTDALSLYMRQDTGVVSHTEAYLKVHGQLNISIMTFYEILRGLKSRGATTKIRQFRRLVEANDVLPLTDEIIEQASDTYAVLHRRGELIGEVDTLIAATALIHNLVLIANNEKHFNRVPGLQIENWSK